MISLSFDNDTAVGYLCLCHSVLSLLRQHQHHACAILQTGRETGAWRVLEAARELLDSCLRPLTISSTSVLKARSQLCEICAVKIIILLFFQTMSAHRIPSYLSVYSHNCHAAEIQVSSKELHTQLHRAARAVPVLFVTLTLSWIPSIWAAICIVQQGQIHVTGR